MSNRLVTVFINIFNKNTIDKSKKAVETSKGLYKIQWLQSLES